MSPSGRCIMRNFFSVFPSLIFIESNKASMEVLNLNSLLLCNFADGRSAKFSVVQLKDAILFGAEKFRSERKWLLRGFEWIFLFWHAERSTLSWTVPVQSLDEKLIYHRRTRRESMDESRIWNDMCIVPIFPSQNVETWKTLSNLMHLLRWKNFKNRKSEQFSDVPLFFNGVSFFWLRWPLPTENANTQKPKVES